jgi:hypothetical protein
MTEAKQREQALHDSISMKYLDVSIETEMLCGLT